MAAKLKPLAMAETSIGTSAIHLASYADFGAGIGVGLRSQHAAEFIEKKPSVDWLEVLADNYLSAGGIERRRLN